MAIFLSQRALNNKNSQHKMKPFIVILALLLTGCGSIGAYTENLADTQVRFSEYSTNTDNHLKKKANLKVAQTGLVSGNTLLYSAEGNSLAFNSGQGSSTVIYPLWINESEVDEVEFAINKYRHWQAQTTPDSYLTIKPINEYVSEWMNGVTFKFGLYNSKQGKAFLSVCYEFSEVGSCTFTYMIDKKSVELLSDDLDKFKLYQFH
ncbi:hypothetical protein [Colwellia psychrerythraea]|uniref:Uncharacterized protein n=1 Tax=Colwellia psychrerythraea TaxID=28229 RepID=A0A099L1W2_COLPS|nr:hypothetical protein [Colwellia psychrerythraea]KGJ96435.1 hypothetical protein GAB14E_0382 [Colwellia psychrerythraea]